MLHRFASKPRKGFTLLELIVVIVVLGVISALAVPGFNAVKTRMAESVATSNAESVVRDARALAALDAAPLNDSYLDAAGAESTGYDATTNTLTVTSSGPTVIATIDATTGAITLSSGSNGGGDLTINTVIATKSSSLNGVINRCVYGNGCDTGKVYLRLNNLGLAAGAITAGDLVTISGNATGDKLYGWDFSVGAESSVLINTSSFNGTFVVTQANRSFNSMMNQDSWTIALDLSDAPFAAAIATAPAGISLQGDYVSPAGTITYIVGRP